MFGIGDKLLGVPRERERQVGVFGPDLSKELAKLAGRIGTLDGKVGYLSREYLGESDQSPAEPLPDPILENAAKISSMEARVERLETRVSRLNATSEEFGEDGEQEAFPVVETDEN